MRTEHRFPAIVFLITFVLVLCCYAVAFAQDKPSKSAASASDANVAVVSVALGATTTPFVTALSTSIKPAGGKDLFVTFSAQTALFTTSLNNDTPAIAATFTAESVGIQVRLKVDGVAVPIAPPNPLSIITLDNLIRITSRFTPGQTDFLVLVVDEGGARSYTWIVPDVGVGVHTVTVETRFVFANERVPAAMGTASSIAAIIGPRTLTVEEVDLR